MPDLSNHFFDQGVQPPAFLTQWFLTMFIDCFPLSMVKIMWDTFICDGIICDGLPTILKISVSILSALKEQLLSKKGEQIITFFAMMKTSGENERIARETGKLLIKHTKTLAIPEHFQSCGSSDLEDDDSKTACTPFFWTPAPTWFGSCLRR